MFDTIVEYCDIRDDLFDSTQDVSSERQSVSRDSAVSSPSNHSEVTGTIGDRGPWITHTFLVQANADFVLRPVLPPGLKNDNPKSITSKKSSEMSLGSRVCQLATLSLVHWIQQLVARLAESYSPL